MRPWPVREDRPGLRGCNNGGYVFVSFIMFFGTAALRAFEILCQLRNKSDQRSEHAHGDDDHRSQAKGQAQFHFLHVGF